MRKPLPTLAVLALALASAGLPAAANAHTHATHAGAARPHRGKAARHAKTPAKRPATPNGQPDGGSLYQTAPPRTAAAGAVSTTPDGGTTVGATGATGASGTNPHPGTTASGPASTTGGASQPASPGALTGPTGAGQPSGPSGSTGPSGPVSAPGGHARILANGLAQAPANAPAAVKAAIAAGNQLIGQPYVYGGGHQSFISNGYDCSGTVSFALHGANLLSAPLDSSSLELWGAPGAGAWITVYTNPAHAYVDVAGIRLDTSTAGDPGGLSGPRWRPLLKSDKGFLARHFPGL